MTHHKSHALPTQPRSGGATPTPHIPANLLEAWAQAKASRPPRGGGLLHLTTWQAASWRLRLGGGHSSQPVGRLPPVGRAGRGGADTPHKGGLPLTT